MRIQLIELLNSISEGAIKSLRFPTSEDREKFRQAIYKEKKEFDELRLMTEPDYVVSKLRFDKVETILDGEIIYGVRISFYTQTLPTLNFEILPDLGDTDG